MNTESIISGLADLFRDSQDVEIMRGRNAITFRKDISELDGRSDIYWRGSMSNGYDYFDHRIELLDNYTYRAKDRLSHKKGRDFVQADYLKREYTDNGTIIWNTEYIHEPVREYLRNMGYTRKKPFWTGKRIAALFACIWVPIIIAAIFVLLRLR